MEQQKKLPPAREVIACAELPGEYQNLSDEELGLLVPEHLGNDGRVDLKELEISYRKGVVYLEGVVPSEHEHSILLQTLTDVMGLTSMVDHTGINESLEMISRLVPGRLVNPLQ